MPSLSRITISSDLDFQTRAEKPDRQDVLSENLRFRRFLAEGN
jgi:hypothetical protein